MSMQLVADLECGQDIVWFVSWSKDGRYLASAGADKVIRIWGQRTEASQSEGAWSCLTTLEDAQQRTIRCAEWSPCGQYIAAVSFDSTCAIWERQGNVASWEMVASLEGHDNEVKCAAWSPDGRYIATCGRDRTVWIWEKSGNEFECATVLNKHTQDVKYVEFHPSGLQLMSCSYDDTIKVWQEYDDDWYEAETLTGHDSTVWQFCFLDEETMASCSADKAIIVWRRIAEGSGFKWKRLLTCSDLHDATIYSIHCSIDGFLATGSGDDAIRIFSKEGSGLDLSLSCCTERIAAHAGDINCVRWNPCTTNMLASCADDGHVKLWRFEL